MEVDGSELYVCSSGYGRGMVEDTAAAAAVAGWWCDGVLVVAVAES